MPETPAIGTKFRAPLKRGLISFIGEESRGDVVWWNFIGVNDGKYYSYYPDEVFEADDKEKKTVHRRRSRGPAELPDTLSIEDEAERTPVTYTDGSGESVTIL